MTAPLFRQATLMLILGTGSSGIVAKNLCDIPATPLSEIQGIGNQSPLVGQRVTVQAFVSATYQEQNSLKGFFLVEPIEDQDQDPRSSEGIFVYSTLPVSPGQHVTLTGTVTEYYGLTEITKVSDMSLCPTLSRMPNPVAIPTFQISSSVYEAVESMPITTDTLWITGNNSFERYGELSASHQNRFAEPMTQNQTTPSDDWVIDDGFPGSHSYLHTLISPDNIRLGTQIAPFTAIASFGYGHYRLLPQTPLAATTMRPDPPSPPRHLGNNALSIAQLNVRNLFNGNGNGSGFPTARGAKTLEAYQQQQRKLVMALRALDADIIALTELENDGYGKASVIANLVASLNQGAEVEKHYQFAQGNPQHSGSDAITQGMLYRPAVWDAVDTQFAALESNARTATSARPALVVSLVHHITGIRLQMAVVHFKSRRKGCNEDGNDEPNAGYCYLRRLDMSQRLDALLPLAYEKHDESAPDLLMIAGDMNAYLGEPALDYLGEQGWSDTRELLGNTAEYTYVYQGIPGALDHFLLKSTGTGPSWIQSLKMAQIDWHINASESDALIAYEAALERLTPYRSSDHDPSVLYLTWP